MRCVAGSLSADKQAQRRPATRTLPVRVSPVSGEALDSWLETLAARMDTSWGELLESVGLSSPASQSRWAYTSGWLNALSPQQSASIAGATRADPTELIAMTTQDLARSLGQPAELVGTASDPLLWLRHRRSRYCPKCLAESGGRWALLWRLRWATACLRHSCLLMDVCPACGRYQRTTPPPLTLVPSPGRCANRTSGANPPGSRCCALLSEAETPPFEDREVLRWQRSLMDAIVTGSVRVGIYRHAPVSAFQVFTDMVGIEDCVRSRSSKIRSRSTHSSPTEAAHIAEFWQVISAPTIADAAGRLGQLMDDSANGKRHVRAASVGRGRRMSNGALAIQCSALLDDMTPIDRLRVGAYSSSSGAPQAAVATGGSRIPSVLWANWSSAFSCEGVSAAHMGAVLSVALLMAGTPIALPKAVAALGTTTSHHTVSFVLRRLRCTNGRDDPFNELRLLAHHIDQAPPPIDYARRRALSDDDLLPSTAWRQLSTYLDVVTDDAATHLLARHWLYSRMTGGNMPALPNPEVTRRRRLDVARFSSSLSDDFVCAADEYAQDFLSTSGIRDEPVTWSPPTADLARQLMR